MNRFRHIYLFLIVAVFATIFLPSSSSADEGCVGCDKKSADDVEMPSVPLEDTGKVPPQIALREDPTFNNYLDAYCMKFTQIERHEINGLIHDLNTLNYSVVDFFIVARCRVEKAGGVLAPMLHLTVEAPCSRVGFPEVIYRYYTVIRKSPSTWLSIVNAKNTDGETYLDYVERLNLAGEFSTPSSQACRDDLIAFACKTGGVYSTAKNKTCPAG
jgi:hypothetical protein